MTHEILLVLGLLAAALALLAVDVVPMEVVALGTVVVLVAAGILTAEEAFQGFGSEAILLVGSLFVMGGGLLHAGLFETVGVVLRRASRRRPGAVLALLVSGTASVSAWVSNAATVAMVLPVAAQVARGGVKSSRVFMPVAFAALLGGTCTLVGTSTNVVVAGELVRLGEPALGFFELGLVGLPVTVFGVAYLLVIAPLILDRLGDRAREDAEGVRRFLGEVVVDEGSAWAGRTLAQVRPRDDGLEVVGVVRTPGEDMSLPDASWRFQPGDLVVVKAAPADLLRLAARARLKTLAEAADVADAGSRLAAVEVLVAPGSGLAGHTLKAAQFRHRFDAVALAVYRHGHALHDKVGRIRLHVGDLLLVQGAPAAIERLRETKDLLVLDDVHHARHGGARGWLALGIFATAVVAGVVTGQFAVAALAGAVLMVAVGCLTPEEAQHAAQWRLLAVVGGMIALASGMAKTGAATWLAERVVDGVGDAGPVALLAALFVLTVVLTQPLSNQAAALLVLPVALSAAEHAGIPARQAAITVTIAASCSFVTPLEPACILVFGPGHYRFRDFVIVGLPLTLIVMAVTLALVRVAWPA